MHHGMFSETTIRVLWEQEKVEKKMEWNIKNRECPKQEEYHIASVSFDTRWFPLIEYFQHHCNSAHLVLSKFTNTSISSVCYGPISPVFLKLHDLSSGQLSVSLVFLEILWVIFWDGIWNLEEGTTWKLQENIKESRNRYKRKGGKKEERNRQVKKIMEIVRGPKGNSNNKDIYLLRKIDKESMIMYNCLTLIKLLLTNGCFRFEFVGSGTDLYCTGTTHTSSWRQVCLSLCLFVSWQWLKLL